MITPEIITQGYIGGMKGTYTTVVKHDIGFLDWYCVYIEVPNNKKIDIDCYNGLTFNDYLEPDVDYPIEGLEKSLGMTVIGWDYQYSNLSEFEIIEDVLETVKKMVIE